MYDVDTTCYWQKEKKTTDLRAFHGACAARHPDLQPLRHGLLGVTGSALGRSHLGALALVAVNAGVAKARRPWHCGRHRR